LFLDIFQECSHAIMRATKWAHKLAPQFARFQLLKASSRQIPMDRRSMMKRIGVLLGTYGSCQSGSCSMQYAKALQNGTQVIWSHYNIVCCGTYVTAWVNTGASCGNDLSSKDKSTMELLLSRGVRLRATDCMGRPVIFTSPAGVMARNSPPVDLFNHDKHYVSDLWKEQ
jgi:hypothetical protein